MKIAPLITSGAFLLLYQLINLKPITTKLKPKSFTLTKNNITNVSQNFLLQRYNSFTRATIKYDSKNKKNRSL